MRQIAKRDAGVQIKTPQALIHIRHKISLLQYKYWILLLRELRQQFENGVPADEKGFRAISMDEISNSLGYTPNKTQLWNDLNGLKNETIAYNVLSKDGTEVKYGAGFVSEWKVHPSRVEFRLPSFIEDVVRGLDEPRAIFQLLNWEIFNHFSGKYEAIIYKLCRDYRGVKRTPYFTLPDFREYMGLEQTEYKEFRDLNKFVISGPVKTINESDASDIRVEMEFERNGRKIVGLRFLIEEKQQVAIPFEEFDVNVFRFAKVPIEPALQKKYLQGRSEGDIQLCIERANEYGEKQAKKGIEPNYGALYRTAITEGWHVQAAEKRKKKEQVESRLAAEKAAAERQQVAKEAQLKAAAERVKNIFSRFAAMPELAQDEIRERFRSSITAIQIRKVFDKQGEEAAMIRPMFADYLESIEFGADAAAGLKVVTK